MSGSSLESLVGSISRGVSALCAAWMLSGCNIILPASYIIEGPPKTDAAYILPQKKTGVIVDDRSNRMSRVALRVGIGDAAGETLLDQGVVPEVVSTRDSVAYARRNDTSTRPISIQRIGEALGVDQVIYIEVDKFVLMGGSAEGGPEAIVLVKVIDISSGSRLWPPAGSEAVQSALKDINPELTTTSAGRREVEDKLAAQTGDDVAKLFFAHERRELGGRLGVKK